MNGKRAFVTGHTGFKGGWLTRWLTRMGAEVTGYSLSDDIRDFDRLHAAVQRSRPDIIFHLAAQVAVPDAKALPLYTFDVNVMGTANVLEVARRYGCPVVCVTSDKVYLEKVGKAAEDAPIGGIEPYSASKACAENVAAVWEGYGVPLVTARAGNCIGGGDFGVYRLLPNCITALRQGVPIVVHDPKAVRPFQHVLEPLHGYIMLAERLMAGSHINGAWNFGPDEEWSVQQVVERVIDLYGSGSWTTSANTCDETQVLTLDSNKAKFRLGWKPRWDTAMALEQTMYWYDTKSYDGVITAYETSL